MAAAGHPVLELYPQGGAVSLESALFDNSKSSAPAPTPSRLVEGAGYTSQEEPKEDFTEICKEQSTTPPTREVFTREGNLSALQINEDPTKQKQSCPPPLVEPHSHHHQIAVNAINNPQAGRTGENMKSSPLPVHRSHSGTLPLVKQEMPPPGPGRETRGLACKQPMPLQPCNIITTIYRGAIGGEGGVGGGGGVQQPLCRCFCVPQAKVEEVEKKDHLPSKCDDPLCYVPYIHHGSFEDTFAAYCHPQPIPAPPQVLPHPVESSGDTQRARAPTSMTDQLTLPRLISSVSETGLDAKHLLRCCNVNCSWISTLPPGAGPQYQNQCALADCFSGPRLHVKTETQHVGTMTAHKELKDVGVQTGQTLTAHVFPRICLAEESTCESSSTQTPNTVSDGGTKSDGGPKSPVKEVKWDAEGMTWEVYGASVDPEELGLAIQKHLELQIKETASRAAKLSRQNTSNSRQSGNAGSQRKRSRMMGSIRTPACCARTTTAVD